MDENLSVKERVQQMATALGLSADNQDEIGEMIAEVATIVNASGASPLPALIALAFASGVFLTSFAVDRRRRLSVMLKKVQALAMRESTQARDTLVMAVEDTAIVAEIVNDETLSIEALGDRLILWFETQGFQPKSAVPAMLGLVARVVREFPPGIRAGAVAEIVQELRENCGVAYFN